MHSGAGEGTEERTHAPKDRGINGIIPSKLQKRNGAEETERSLGAPRGGSGEAVAAHRRPRGRGAGVGSQVLEIMAENFRSLQT